MIEPNMIPNLDPNPLPAPFWVFKVLLVVTFFLHIVAMNLMLGGAVMAIAAKWRAKDTSYGTQAFFDIARKLPSLLPATITLGVAPLLFVQVLYGQYFYTSSIIMAWPWFLILALITLAYYGFYYVSFRSGQQPGKAGRVMWFSAILLFIVGFMFSNNFTLSQTPSRWSDKYFSDPSGWNLNLAEPTLIPRYLHFFVAAVAVGGILLVFMAMANWKRDRAYARLLLNLGGKTFMYATMAQMVVGLIFLVTLPRDMRMLFMGDNALATALLLVGVVGGIAAIFLMADALRKENLRVAGYLVPGILGVVILSMSIMRDILRDAYLKPWFRPEQFTVQTQWSVFPLFLVVFVAGVILWFVMLARFGLLGGKRAGARATSPDSTGAKQS